ncbi:proteasome accessory factor B [Modestobacter sp. DSM 44400]|uniref:helix-turn-helix transcriptional regulator n=1 Tax=Modestobacter sp. DSM 44400 TaxID=1550230 RepID=UPI00089D20AD|nr:WYL domain-containing protein [Modestobacter sp. DSM 44400]SDY21343.1 proteasome accessory factor B [Modestobacter sp. DSM 44400]
MAAKRAERLVNLVIALLGTRQYVSAAKIRATVPGYEADDGSERADEAFKRMFERDKAELREIGVPLETGRTSVFDTEDGYRIARGDYELPEITLTGEEAAAVGLALRLWQSAQLAGAAQSALVKLRAAGVEVDQTRGIPLQPRLDAGEPAFEPCYAAARDRRELTFDYRRPDEDTPVRRRVQPWGVVAWHGHWYLVGHDRDRQAPRVFRLSRVTGTPRASGPAGAFEPPPGLDLAAVVAGHARREETVVVVRARPGTAIGLRRTGTTLGPAPDGDDRVELRTTEPGALADQLAAYGADVLVESPPRVREAVVERLTRLAAMDDREVHA